MQEAFRAGADVVEFDIHPTTDGHFAVFHDWTLDCRTDGRGVTRMHSLAQLKALDIGYGYTADGGRTFPFRGHGTGMMTSLDEVLDAFPDKRLLINIKSNDPHEGHMLSKRLRKLPASRRALLMVYGGDAPIDVVRQQLPGVLTLSRQRLKACLVRYLAIGWTGLVPDACEMSLLLIPVNYASWLLGLAGPVPQSDEQYRHSSVRCRPPPRWRFLQRHRHCRRPEAAAEADRRWDLDQPNRPDCATCTGAIAISCLAPPRSRRAPHPPWSRRDRRPAPCRAGRRRLCRRALRRPCAPDRPR